MLVDDTNDPFAELAAAACNLLADSIGVRYCGAVSLDSEALRGASSEFLRLPDAVREAVVAAVIEAVQDWEFDEDDAQSNRLISAPVPEEVGDNAAALLFPETDTIIFAVPAPGKTLSLTPFRRAAVSALPILYRIDDLRTERIATRRAHKLLSHVEELSKIGGWELVVGTSRPEWSDEIYTIHDLEPGSEVTLERVLQLYPSPAREKLSLELERAAAEGTGFELTAPIQTPAGEPRIVRIVARSRADRSGRKLYGIAQDVTRQLATERRLWWAANHDPVTSLPNRLLFEDRLGVAVRRAQREERPLALLIIEISDFARLAEHAGYTVPDKHMMEAAARLGAVTRESDTVARVSINEFALILWDVDSTASFNPVMERLDAQFEEMQAENGGGSGIVLSAGTAFYPAHASGHEELMRAAEMALSRSKRKLDQGVVIFDTKLADDAAQRRDTILARARDSLAKREFVPYYQPQIDMETGEVVGVEALVRWQTPDMTLDAKDFTYALDDHEIGSQVGRVVLENVIADLAKLRQVTDQPFRVSINASRTEVLRNDFLDTFLEKTREGNLKPTDFIIEITEDVILGVDDQTLHDKISFLVSSGVEFSLDDFGTGYASLIHVTSFPIKEIKIDKQFVTGIESDRRKRAIVKGIIQIARSMGLNIIAEGVETVEQQEVLRDIGCRYAQGYLYSFPVPFPQ
ncbi:MAG: bifunctional diguanylate cyclase/phosphodiesterase, partial [Pseudomonadota bacterium]